MKIKNIVTVLLIALILASCAPAAKVVPTETAIPTSTFTPIPPTPTFTPTPSPENIADAKDLSVWVDEFVHAYGGKIKVNGVEMDAGQLTDEIRKNGDAFMELKKIKDITYSFLVVNDTPLAIMGENGKWEEATLKNITAANGFSASLHTAAGYLQDWSPNNKLMREIVTKHFNGFVLDYDIVWWNPDYPQNSVRPNEQTYQFANPSMANLAVETAQKYKLQVTGQTLVMQIPQYIPQWVSNLRANKDQLRKVMVEHISTVVKHYGTDVEKWVVVAELENELYRNFWTSVFRLDDISWLEDAYNTAHDANPQAKLLYSDFGIEFGGTKADRVYSIIKRLKDNHIPIDGIAFQMHIYGRDFANLSEKDWEVKVNELKAEINRYNELGMIVVLPEWDIDMRGIDNSQKYELQGDIAYRLTKAMLEVGVKDFGFMNAPDNLSWRETSPGWGDLGADATLFFDDGSSKPFYYGVMKAIYESPSN